MNLRAFRIALRENPSQEIWEPVFYTIGLEFHGTYDLGVLCNKP